ncbi:MAG: UDP-3-O-(3-hydroxymyristoyl)glucosamine N-acyltransferase [Lentisphaerae bacterium]|nr:UDP-3-O-(3-hydroxymyristoyl)glucosamine N-acyltransferase [Lentisphaerota bacterium]
MSMTWTVAQLAAQLDAEVEGAGDAVVSRLAALDEAQAGDLSFLTSSRYAAQMASTAATAVIVGRDWSGPSPARALLRVADPNKACAEAAQFFAPPPPKRLPGIHPTAVIAADARLGEGVHVGPWCVIEARARIGDQTVIEAQCFIGEDVAIGSHGHLYPQVSIRERVRIGDRFIAHCGAVVGSDGFGYTVTPQPGALPRVAKIPQTGTVVIGHDVEIGANATIDRARFGETRIGNHVKIDNLVQIGHNVRIGDCSGVIAQAGIAGSTRIGAGVMIWAQAGLSGHLTVGNGAQVGPQAGVARDVPDGQYVIGSPAASMREMAAVTLAPRQIVKLRSRLAELEARLAALEGTSGT